MPIAHTRRRALWVVATLLTITAPITLSAQEIPDPPPGKLLLTGEPLDAPEEPGEASSGDIRDASEEALDEEEDLEALDALLDEASGEGEDEGEALPEELVSWRPVVVSYTPEEIAKTGGSAQIISEEELEAFEYSDPHSVLQKVPGVYIRQEDGFGLRPNIGIRGGNSERSKKVTLMEDGVLFGPAPYSAPAAYYFPLMQRVTGVEVFKGPGAILYGPNTIGGAINLTTRQPGPGSQGALDVAGGVFPSARAHLWQSWGGARGGVVAEGVHLRSAGFKELDGGGPTGFSRSEVMVKGHVNSEPAGVIYHRVSTTAVFSQERSDETYLGLSQDDFDENPYRRYVGSAEDRMNFWRLALRLDYQLEVGDSLDVTTTAYRHNMSRAWKKFNNFGDGTGADSVLDAPDSPRNALFYDILRGEADSSTMADELIIGTNARDYISQGVQSVARHRFQTAKLSNKIEGGVRLHYDQIERDHSEERYRMEGGRLQRTEAPTTFPTRNIEDATAMAAWVVDQLSVSRLTLTPGLRVERITMTSEDLNVPGAEVKRGVQQILIPGLGTHVDVWKGLGVLAGVHRGFSPVAPGQAGEIQPETSVNYEAGLRLDRPDAVRLEAIGFFNDYKNMVGECTFAAGCLERDLDEQFNAGRAWIYGAELLGSYGVAVREGKDRLTLLGSYTYTQTELLTSFQSENPQLSNVQPGDELPYVPRHQAALNVGYQHPRAAANVGVTYVGEMREEASQGEAGRRTDAYAKLDALVSVNVWRSARVYSRGDNLLNAQPVASRRPYGARPIMPRFVELGVKLDWPMKAATDEAASE